MRILAVGGGSGGHVTPIAAVLKSVSKYQDGVEYRVWCDRKFYRQAKATIHHVNPDARVDMILAGKLRRYHTLSIWQQLRRLNTIVLPNIRDFFLIVGGTIQSFFKLIIWRPNVVFCKGGFVCLPVGVAAHALRIPIVLHDSDALPGLANKILSRWAVSIGTGAPLNHYDYSADKARYVGIPIDEKFRPYSRSERTRLKTELGFTNTQPLVVITGGGLGAQSINQAVVAMLDQLLEVTNLLLISGTHNYQEVVEKVGAVDTTKFQVHAFISDKMVETLAAADLVVSRAGATTLIELAALAKPTIIVPNPHLTGGHQLKNAAVYSQGNAAEVIDDDQIINQPQVLLDTVASLILNNDALERMAKAIQSFSKPNAANDTAQLIIMAANRTT